MQTQPMEHEETLLHILHTLPTKSVEQVVDFARFLQWREIDQWHVLHEDETEAEVQADIERWDASFAASPDKLKKLANRAREEIMAGRTMDMIFTAI
ncbi:MAG: hypothetical protein KBG20_17415 [Caldilineaceae bacterium]|nr:hypothetical protein [Caldilineaceae bacterium]MBP8109152.1 hypothetical protein [Caldilineaceae bacterium]MBP8121532.1 hypothetical protein [Caldilineaceae bacterium]MBP9074089.1 hypothetical protein [Caldilineaceae bacterium]